VVPVFNEEESLPVLQAEIAAALDGPGGPGSGAAPVPSWEVIYVDDCSTDASLEVLLELRAADERVKVVRFKRNFGQTPAMSAGFERASGRRVVTLDADLQNDPADIPKLLAQLDAGHDLVVGWRKNRRDGFVLRKIPSWCANRLLALWTGARVHDTGCTLKAYSAELVRNLPIYAEQHRFLPMLALASGARIGEAVVNHRPRRFGASKYGLGRAVRVLLDLLTVRMLSTFSRGPLAYFALLATPFLVLTMFVLVTGVTNFGNLAGGDDWSQPLLVTLLLLSMAGAFFLMLGLLAELAVKASGGQRHRVEPLVRGGRQA